MVSIKYVGKTKKMVDPILGKAWLKKQPQDIDDRNAPFYLFYKGIFEDARPEKVRKKHPIKGRERTRLDILEDEEVEVPPAVNIAMMDEAGLQRYVEANYGSHIAKAPLPQMRDQVVSIMRERG